MEFEKLLAKCFRRRTYTHPVNKRTDETAKCSRVRGVILEISKKGKIQRAIAKTYQQRLVQMEININAEARAERLKRTSATLTVNDRFSPNGYWKLKKAANKGVRKEQVMSSILKPNGVEVEEAAAIIQAYQDEFENRLRNREPKPGWEEYTAETNRTIRKWLQGGSSSSPPFSPAELDKVRKTLKEDSSPGVDYYPTELFTKAGTGVMKSILALCNQVKDSKEIPEQWDLVKIVTIYKQKGSKKELKYYRGIFLAIVMSKVFEYNSTMYCNECHVKVKRYCAIGNTLQRKEQMNYYLIHTKFCAY